MKVNIGTIDVDDRDRYVIAKYYGEVTGDGRTRATRRQVREFSRGAIRSQLREAEGTLRRRQRNVAARLDVDRVEQPTLRDHAEKQLSLFAAAGGGQ